MTMFGMRSGFLCAVFAAAILVLCSAGGIAIAQQTKTLADISAKVHNLKGMKLKQFLAQEEDGNKTRASEISLDNVSIEDITIAGITYPLIIIDGDDTPQWSNYKKYLSPDVASAPSSKPTDEQVFKHLQKLTLDASRRFQALEAKTYADHKDVFIKQFPMLSEKNRREAARVSYINDNNWGFAADAQRSFDEYTALGTLSGAFQFYLKFKKDL